MNKTRSYSKKKLIKVNRCESSNRLTRIELPFSNTWSRNVSNLSNKCTLYVVIYCPLQTRLLSIEQCNNDLGETKKKSNELSHLLLIFDIYSYHIFIGEANKNWNSLINYAIEFVIRTFFFASLGQI